MWCSSMFNKYVIICLFVCLDGNRKVQGYHKTCDVVWCLANDVIIYLSICLFICVDGNGKVQEYSDVECGKAKQWK